MPRRRRSSDDTPDPSLGYGLLLMIIVVWPVKGWLESLFGIEPWIAFLVGLVVAASVAGIIQRIASKLMG